MKKLVLSLVLIVGILGAHAQEIAPGVYWVYFKDKAGSSYQMDQPGLFLSERSINRRAMQDLEIDQRDLPVNPAYLQEIKDMGVEIRHVSRWLNGIAMIQMDDPSYLQVLQKPFTDTMAWEPEAEEVYLPPRNGKPRFEPPLAQTPEFNYGVAREQVEMVHTDDLHELGYTGKGVWIGVMDAGFYNMDSLPSFISLFDEGRILGTRNFVNESSVYRLNSSHGMAVSSIMAGQWDGYLVGTAPHAKYLLCSTEDSDQETRLEEIAWIEAAEYADSLGVDVLNTSLGYSDFDGVSYDYSYSDMNGKNTFISRAASLTASRGMILCTSAGNEGNTDWYYITAPADASDVLTVGASDSTYLLAGFSSRGPSYDGRIKPDVTAMGRATGLQHRNGDVSRGNGTSFSSPVVAGSVASLWQAFPELPALDLIQKVKESSHRNSHPDSNYGFGFPNMLYAYQMITRVPVRFKPGEMEIWPNPAGEYVTIRIPESGEHELHIYDLNGRITCTRYMHLPGELKLPSNLASGIYILEVRTPGTSYRSRLLKQ